MDSRHYVHITLTAVVSSSQSAVANKPRDATCFLEMSLRIKSHKTYAIPNCHFTSVPA